MDDQNMTDKEFRDVRRWRNDLKSIREIMLERAEYDLEWALKHKHSAEEITNLEARIAKLKGPSES